MGDERFGMPGHAPQHDLGLQSTTPQGSWANIGGGGDWSAPQSAPVSYGGGGGWVGGGGGGVAAGPYIPQPRSYKVAIILAMLFGPLGLFYAGFLHGLIAFFTVVPVVQAVTLASMPVIAGRFDPLWVAIPTLWAITVPWAILGTALRNWRLARRKKQA